MNLTISSVAVDVGLLACFITVSLFVPFPLIIHRHLHIHSITCFFIDFSLFVLGPPSNASLFRSILNTHIKAVNLDRQPLPQINLSELSLHHLFISKSKHPSYSFNLSTSHIFGILSFLLTNCPASRWTSRIAPSKALRT